jgi:hypothetical protein
MSLITVPRLPDATEEYDKHQMSQMVQTLEQMIFVLNNTYVPQTLKEEEEKCKLVFIING